MSKLVEGDIEQWAIEQLQGLGYRFVHGPDIEPKSGEALRAYTDVLIASEVKTAIARLNPELNGSQCEEVFRTLQNINHGSLIRDNREWHKYLTQGINIEIQQNGQSKGHLARLIDFDDVHNNVFWAVNQVTIRQQRSERRPDIVLYINGLPLVVLELKNAASENVTLQDAFQQIQTYQQDIPSLFTYNAFNIISDGLEAQAGTISADFSRYMAWKTANGIYQAKNTQPQLEVLITGMLGPVTLLDLLRHFMVYEDISNTDKQGIKTIKTVKKMAAYHQY